MSRGVQKKLFMDVRVRRGFRVSLVARGRGEISLVLNNRHDDVNSDRRLAVCRTGHHGLLIPLIPIRRRGRRDVHVRREIGRGLCTVRRRQQSCSVTIQISKSNRFILSKTASEETFFFSKFFFIFKKKNFYFLKKNFYFFKVNESD